MQFIRLLRQISTIIVPNLLQTGIAWGVFYACRLLEEVKFPDSLKIICGWAFWGEFIGNNITEIILPDSLEIIGENAFGATRNLKEITMSPSLKSLESGAFMGSGIIIADFSRIPVPLNLNGDPFVNTSEELVIYVAAESLDAYRTAHGCSSQADRILVGP